jgi:hypothetical protein
MNKNVAEGYDLWPRNVGVPICQFLGNPRSSLAYSNELLNYGEAVPTPGMIGNRSSRRSRQYGRQPRLYL